MAGRIPLKAAPAMETPGTAKPGPRWGPGFFLGLRGAGFDLVPQRWNQPVQLVERTSGCAEVFLRDRGQELVALDDYRARRIDAQLDLIFTGLQHHDLDLVADRDSFVYFTSKDEQFAP